jgi:hypothetical protein
VCRRGTPPPTVVKVAAAIVLRFVSCKIELVIFFVAINAHDRPRRVYQTRGHKCLPGLPCGSWLLTCTWHNAEGFDTAAIVSATQIVVTYSEDADDADQWPSETSRANAASLVAGGRAAQDRHAARKRESSARTLALAVS